MAAEKNSRLVYSTGGDKALEERKAATPVADGTRIRVRLDRRASGRVVTVVSGLPGSLADVAALAKALKSACGTGGTSDHSTLELQGDQRHKVEAALAARGLKSKRAGG